MHVSFSGFSPFIFSTHMLKTRSQAEIHIFLNILPMHFKQNLVVTTKINVIPRVDQRFNLARWGKLEKDFDFPLCFATRKADFFFFLSLLEKQRSGHPQRNEQVWPFISMSAYITNQHKKSLSWVEKIC